MTYGRPPLERIDLSALERLELCPPSRGSGSRTVAPTLDRWKAVREASVEWHQRGMPDGTAEVAEIEGALFGGWDAVQRRMLEELFAAYRRLFPRDAHRVELDPVGAIAVHEPTNRSVTVAVQAEAETSDGVLALRIKTGRTITSQIEAAAFYRPDESRTLVDLRLASDDIVTIAPPPDPDAIVEEVALRWDRAQARPRQGRVAGFHCHGCARPARCGQYPVIGDRPVSSRTRTLLVSKSRLANLGTCVRSAAWPVVYGIPRDDGEEFDSTNLVVGNQFHTTVAAALLSDDPGPLYEAAYSTVAPSEVEDLRFLFDQHEALWSDDEYPVRATRTEYQFGVTFVVDGRVDRRGRVESGEVAVCFMAATDVNGWEDDRIAAVVEHRTGHSSSALPYEADLYAVSAATALESIDRAVEGVAVHFHHVRADPANCERILYSADDIVAATARLESAARVFASLDPFDATSPSHTVGPWCQWCQWVARCVPHRD